MLSISSELAAEIATCHGVVTDERLIADGVTSNQIRRAVRTGSVVRSHRGVLRLATAPVTFEARCAAACMADDELVITGRAAGSLWGFRHISTPRVPIVLARHDQTSLTSGVLVRRTNVLSPEDFVRRQDGITVASPPRTWFDCGRDVDDETFEAITEWVLDRHTSMPTLWRTVRRLDARGRPGLARVRRVLSQRPTWQKPAGSRLELRVLKALCRAGLPELVRQLPLRLPNGVVVHPDGADSTIKWAIEIDHVTWHGGRIDAQRDKSRDRGLRRIGWQVERVTDRELEGDFASTIRDVAELYWLRAAAVTGARRHAS